jgi:catalase
MTPEEANNASFNPFDVTKVWPHQEYPLIEVGRLVLNRNPRNYFAEVEQIAFSPSHFVPGIETSPDKMLQGRLFSYPDTHRHRLGVNYQQIPVNRPLKEPLTYQRDGSMAVNGNMGGTPNYFPNSQNGPQEASAHKFHEYSGNHSTVKKYDTRDEDNFVQCGEFYRKTLTPAERERLTSNIADTLVKASKEVQARAVANFSKADPNYGRRIQEKLDQLSGSRPSSKYIKQPPAALNPPRKPFVVVPPTDDLLPRM